MFELPSSLVKRIIENAFIKNAWDPGVIKRLEFRTSAAGEGGVIEMDLNAFSDEVLSHILDECKKNGHSKEETLVNNLLIIRKNPEGKIKRLNLFPAALVSRMEKTKTGWLFSTADKQHIVPWLFSDVKYHPRHKDEPAYCVVRLVACSSSTDSRNGKSIASTQFSFKAGDIAGKNLMEILADHDFLLETDELLKDYEEELAHWITMKELHHHQFQAVNKITGENKSGWKFDSFNIPDGRKVINEETLVSRYMPEKYLCVAYKKSDDFSEDVWDRRVEQERGKMMELPIHCKLYVFDLELHTRYWLPARALKKYEWVEGLKDKLVLPESHHDLIEILSMEMDVVLDDIVQGKSGGTTILCKGAPGLGKTLTAEVYAEYMKRPLYKIHSGQLGIDPNQIEKNLKYVLENAQRWRAYCLIDECDVFVKSRGDDIHQNAVVASFLKTIEYYSGMLFLTTNRAEDIDDAILSRCIAIVKYDLPNEKECKSIWKILSTQFNAPISDSVIDEAITNIGTLPGRDIKEILKLAIKFKHAHKMSEIDYDIIRKCAVFRGLI